MNVDMLMKYTRVLLFFTLVHPWNGFVLGEEGKDMSARCSLFGRQHIQTFDGQLFDFPGDCSYMLAGDCQKRSFTLLGDYQHGQRKSISVYLGEVFEIHLFFDGTVTQGGKRIPLPYASNGVFVETEAGYYKISSEEYGFLVKTDNNGNAQVLLSMKHFNKTCGLCGNFNMDPNDDYITQEGFVAESSYDFANSWALHGSGKPCKRAVPPSKTCNISLAVGEDPMQRCRLLKTSSVFLKCSHLVDSEPFVALCEEDTCHCNEDQNCQCDVFMEYARSCAQKGLVLKGWHKDSHCNPKCPLGMEYNECTIPCSHTCQNLNINEVCKNECEDGCRCPEGKIIDDDHCVDISECSCVHAGKRYPPSSSISQDCNTCVCRHGFWQCSNEECPGECFVTGQSHYKSFDNKFFTFGGICHYLFAKDCWENTFAVIIETVQCADDRDAICAKSVTLRFQETANITIKMKHGGGVSVGGMDIQTPLFQGPLRILRTTMSSIRLTYNEDIMMDWDGRGKLLLKLSPVYAGKTCGLCGNYNGNQRDDFTTPAGLNEAHVENFGNSWKINGECEDILKQDNDPCILNPKRVKYAEEACAVLFSPEFKPCHYEVNPAPFFKNCRYDVCSCSDGHECLCSAVASYATACTRKGVLINWRTSDFCEMRCPEDQTYQQCGSPCNETCRSLSFPDVSCSELCIEGCFCSPGLYATENGECVSKSQCPCYYDGELFQPGDVISNHINLCYCENGAMTCSSNELPGAMLSDMFFNDLPSLRVKRALMCRPPMEKFICSSHLAEGIECTKTCQNYDLECVSQGCISGCMCPAGKVRHKNRCISPESCPCFYNGKEYLTGSSVTMDCNTCVCRNRKWVCTEKICDGTCKVIGEANYLTFDGLKYIFPGLCQYVLVQDYCNGGEGTFRILVENSGCGVPGQKCSKYITILYEGGVIEMLNGMVTMKKPVSDQTQIEIIKSGLYYIILLGQGLSVMWNLGTRVTVQMQGHYRNKVCGLCGNFDGIQNNDLLSSNNQLEVEPVDFGNSWKVSPHCADAIQLPSQCNDNIAKLVSVEQSCSVLSSELFKECNRVVDPEPYWEICTFDTCSCQSIGDCVCFCDAIAAYAQECAERGVVVHWRSNDLCPLSCEDLNIVESAYHCEWRYNACAPACPITCQHPEPLDCPAKCVEGCHSTCPLGKILDEVAMKCIDPTECQVCVHEGRRIAHGKKIILNPESKELCKICHCQGNYLKCELCPVELSSTVAPEAPLTTPYMVLSTTPVPESACSKMMDLAFMVDGSSSLSEEDFEVVKQFILNVVEQFRMGPTYTRVTVLQFYSGIKSYGLQVHKSVFKKMVKDMKYSGGETAFINEALKYLVWNIYDKDKRENAPRVAVLLAASTSPRNVKSMVKLLSKNSITMISVGLGPYVSQSQIKQIGSYSPSNKVLFLSSVSELDGYTKEITEYLCQLGRAPTVQPPKETTLRKTTPAPITTTTSQFITPGKFIPHNEIPPSSSTSPPFFTSTVSFEAVLDITFVIEGSEKVGERNFNLTREFLLQTIKRLPVGEKTIHITIIQYSYEVIIEYTFTQSQEKTEILEKVKHMEWQMGNATNTGKAVETISENTFTTEQGDRDQVPNLVFLISSHTPSDVITKPPESSQINIIPIGVGPQINEIDLDLISFPKKPILIQNYDELITTVPEIIEIIQKDLLHTTPASSLLNFTPTPTTSLPASVLCDRLMDVIIMLDGTSSMEESQFEEVKTFMKAFINQANIGVNGTHVAVVQYGSINTLEVSWVDQQTRENLISLVNIIQQRESAPVRLGEALHFAVQSAISEAHGGRPGVPKIAVVIVTQVSQDSVEKAAKEALSAGLLVFPIGIGNNYNNVQLITLAGKGMQHNVIHLSQIENLPAMVTLDKQFIDKLCRAGPPGVCVDDEGNERKPGESWKMADKCYSVICHPSGALVMQTHKINCEKMQKPVCRNNLPAVKVEETCGCRWSCPCFCMGSSTNHIVTFDGHAFKLTGFCSYTLLMDKTHDVDIILHSQPCATSSEQSCMKSIEVIHDGINTVLNDKMKVTVNGLNTNVPFRSHGVEVALYGALIYELKILKTGYVLTFTPKNNEFTIQLNSAQVATKTAGLCGFCDQNDANDFVLKNGTVTVDSTIFIKDWTTEGPSGVNCVPIMNKNCTHPISDQCLVLQSSLFQRCHSFVPVADYVALCQENSCHGADICEIISAYSMHCRLQGICIEWRSAKLCDISCPSSMEFESCKTGCVQQCNNVNTTHCMETPTEGCFCRQGSVLHNGECVPKEFCTQCIDEYGIAHQHLESWIPSHNPCQLCICFDNKQINCTKKPCSNAPAPTCGVCEVLRVKKGSDQCCQEYECVCDMASCSIPPVPKCEDGLTPVLKNPGGCRPVYECACKKEECKLKPVPTCPPHRELSVRKTQCCDQYECTCNCINSTVSCSLGYLSKSVTNDCGCTTLECLPTKVCTHRDIVHQVGSAWEENCQICNCTDEQDEVTRLHKVICVNRNCNEICPMGSVYTRKQGECCGICKKSYCQEEALSPLGDLDTGGHLRYVGEKWKSLENPCVVHECVKINDEVFINHSNMSCLEMDTPKCPVGLQLQCQVPSGACCPHCQCVPVDGCVMNNTIVGAGEVILINECSKCQCNAEGGLVKKYRLLCGKINCSPCQNGYRLEKVNGSCCGKCIATACSVILKDGSGLSLKANEVYQEGCTSYSCKNNSNGELILEKRITNCPPFDRNKCVADGGKVVQMGDTCCETCAEPECKQTLGLLKYIKIDDCMSEKQIDIHYCEGKCSSKSVFSLEKNKVANHCVCCTATSTEAVQVPLRCSNGTILQHTIQNVKGCDCLSHACEGD
ncbi:von Willebrand factor [Erpetoichthys calabaricus]|uniref:von Willebrand factor n=1 Tax=Erpetoichthys calabaricus TaxID=27687 RepID=UPI00223412BF|nr:von Willebrand factor [Erpetoichthys calabaricus]